MTPESTQYQEYFKPVERDVLDNVLYLTQEQLERAGFKIETIVAVLPTIAGAYVTSLYHNQPMQGMGLKEDKTLVTVADKHSDKEMARVLQSLLPDSFEESEETPPKVGIAGDIRTGRDPLDGTADYIKGGPDFPYGVTQTVTSLNNAHRTESGVWVFGTPDMLSCSVATIPAREIFFAEHGRGTFSLQLNSDFTPVGELKQHFIQHLQKIIGAKICVTFDGYNTTRDLPFKNAMEQVLVEKLGGMYQSRQIGSNAVAMTRLVRPFGANPKDMTSHLHFLNNFGVIEDAAPCMLATEAGGLAIGKSGEPWQSADKVVMAGNPTLIGMFREDYARIYHEFENWR